MSRKRRDYIFTCNNFTDEDKAKLDMCPLQYYMYGEEVGEKGTPHLQGHLYFKNPVGIKSVITALPGFHITIPKGNETEQILYCLKEWKNVVEKGTRPMSQHEKGQCEKRRWEEIYEAAEKGKWNSIDAEIKIKFPRALHMVNQGAFIEVDLQPRPILDNFWIVGKTGAGKTEYAKELAGPNRFTVFNFDSSGFMRYKYEDVVILQDFDRRDDHYIKNLKNLTDHDPFAARIMYGDKLIRPKTIIVTSNWLPEQIWHAQPDLEPIFRRFKIVQFPLAPSTPPPVRELQ